ncbi:origin recognition complex subunit 4 [Sporobolomyces koalae]|uniref:origin recognition complex subunit 4 n=1 Tax=Sporobolomyces koalae TaxID=500713 RepID=UPI003170F691
MAKASIVGSMRPRESKDSDYAVSPKHTNPRTHLPSPATTPTRSTRSTGKAAFYVELDGSPKQVAEQRKKKREERKQRKLQQLAPASDDETDESESEEEEEEKEELKPTPKAPTTPRKRTKPSTPIKKTYLPSPAKSTPSRSRVSAHSSDESSDEEKPVVTPKRKRVAESLQLITPVSTPSKRRAQSSAAPRTSSPLKQSTTPSKRRVSTVVPDSDEEVRITPRKTPSNRPKPVTPTPKTTPTAALIPRSSSSTPSRSSLRKQNLPPNLAELKNAPAALRNRLVGYHMEDEGYGVHVETREEEEESSEEQDQDEDMQAPGVAIEQRQRSEKGLAINSLPSVLDVEDDPFISTQLAPENAEYILPTPPSTYDMSTADATVDGVEYSDSFLCKHVQRQLGVLTGAILPEAQLPLDASTPTFDRAHGVMGYPMLPGGYDEWEKPLRGCLDEVVTRGMGNAIVLLGPRGVGKSMLIERTLRVMSYVHEDKHDFVTVKLSGLVHTTDRLALRSIAMQMRDQGFRSVGETEQDLQEGDYSSNSATMTTLLRLLEPSSNTSVSDADSRNESSKPIILIVDEFDLFALHPRQSFLYCLLDIVQGNRRRGGVGVVGVSSRVDCLSLLEKRVRSRCQSHVLQMMLPSSLSDFMSLAKRLMSADQRLWELVKGAEAGQWASRWNREVERFLEEKKVKDHFEGIWRISGNVPTELRSVLTHFLSRLDHKLCNSSLPAHGVPRLEVSALKTQDSQLVRDATLKGLSNVELTVLISCKHLSASTIDFQNGFNLEMAYDAYSQWTRSLEAKGKRVGKSAMTRDTFCLAFDSLRYHEIILPLSTTSTIVPPSTSYLAPSRSIPFKMHRLVPRESDITLEVGNRRHLDGELKKWCQGA